MLEAIFIEWMVLKVACHAEYLYRGSTRGGQLSLCQLHLHSYFLPLRCVTRLFKVVLLRNVIQMLKFFHLEHRCPPHTGSILTFRAPSFPFISLILWVVPSISLRLGIVWKEADGFRYLGALAHRAR